MIVILVKVANVARGTATAQTAGEQPAAAVREQAQQEAQELSAQHKQAIIITNT